jgi:hypothetical protein
MVSPTKFYNIALLNDLETLLRKLGDTNIDLIFTGDLNCDMMANNLQVRLENYANI